MRRIEGEWRYFDEKLGINAPWYTLPTLLWLETIDFKGKNVFEYGVGSSTEWFNEKGAKTYGVDDHCEYAHHARVNYGNVEYATEYWPYIGSIFQHKTEFDFIVIDGAFRDGCCKHSWQFLKKGGFMIIDNYEQPSVDIDWPETKFFIAEKTKNMECEVVVHAESEHYDWQTLVVKKL